MLIFAAVHTFLKSRKYVNGDGVIYSMHIILRGGVAQCVARLTRNLEVVGSSSIKAPRCFLEQETVPLLLSAGWFQERIQV